MPQTGESLGRYICRAVRTAGLDFEDLVWSLRVVPNGGKGTNFHISASECCWQGGRGQGVTLMEAVSDGQGQGPPKGTAVSCQQLITPSQVPGIRTRTSFEGHHSACLRSQTLPDREEGSLQR